MVDEIKDKIISFIEGSERILLEREEYIRLILLVVFSKENIFFYGPPGSAKSLNVSILQKSFPEMEYFRLLMKDDTDSKEVFGDKVKADAASREKRLIEGMLPTANLAFLDEIFKANSEILNALLTILNEKIFDNGADGTIECPLYTAIGASNEFPRDKSLNALFERFLFRIEIPNVKQKESVYTLLDELEINKESLPVFSNNDIDWVEDNYKSSVKQSDMVKLWIYDLREDFHSNLNVHEHYNSDPYEISGRTISKIASVLKISAFLNNRNETDISEIMLLKYILWNNLDQRSDMKRVMDDSLFGREDILRGELELEYTKLKELFKRYYDFYMGIIKGNIEIKQKEFADKKLEISTFKEDLDENLLELDDINGKLNRNRSYEEKIENNIFVYAPAVIPWFVDEFRIFEDSKKAVDVVNELKEEARNICNSINIWVEENPDWFSYLMLRNENE